MIHRIFHILITLWILAWFIEAPAINSSPRHIAGKGSGNETIQNHGCLSLEIHAPLDASTDCLLCGRDFSFDYGKGHSSDSYDVLSAEVLLTLSDDALVCNGAPVRSDRGPPLLAS